MNNYTVIVAVLVAVLASLLLPHLHDSGSRKNVAPRAPVVFMQETHSEVSGNAR